MLNDLLVGLLIGVAYLAPIVLFALAIRPAGEVVESVGRSATTV
jgi:hypothetical protein